MRLRISGLTLLGGLCATGAVAAGLMVAAAGSVGAPEPARLNTSLYANGSSATATYTLSQTPTYAYEWPGSWAVGNMPPGKPCATYAAGAGTILYSTIQASGSYRKCL